MHFGMGTHSRALVQVWQDHKSKHNGDGRQKRHGLTVTSMSQNLRIASHEAAVGRWQRSINSRPIHTPSAHVPGSRQKRCCLRGTRVGSAQLHESSGASAALLPLGVFVPRGSFEPQPLQRQGRNSTIKSKRAWPDLSSSRRRLAIAVTRSPTSASDKVAKKSHSPAPTSRSADATVCAAVRCGCGGRPTDVLGSAHDLAPSGNCDASAVDAAQDEGGAFAGERAPGCVGGGGEGAGMRRPPPRDLAPTDG